MSSYTFDSSEAYRAWCADHDQKPRVATVTGSLSEGGAYAESIELLGSADPPDAIYATLDRLALGALLAAEAKGVRVPDELRIAGCTDSEASRTARPGADGPEPQPRAARGRGASSSSPTSSRTRATERHRIVPSVLIPRLSTRRRGRAGAVVAPSSSSS